jgi:hypothetical protein
MIVFCSQLPVHLYATNPILNSLECLHTNECPALEEIDTPCTYRQTTAAHAKLWWHVETFQKVEQINWYDNIHTVYLFYNRIQTRLFGIRLIIYEGTLGIQLWPGVPTAKHNPVSTGCAECFKHTTHPYVNSYMTFVNWTKLKYC